MTDLTQNTELRIAICDLPLPQGSEQYRHGFVSGKQAVLDLLARRTQPAYSSADELPPLPEPDIDGYCGEGAYTPEKVRQAQRDAREYQRKVDEKVIARRGEAIEQLRIMAEEAASVFESAAKHNAAEGRTVFAHEQQARADRIRAALAGIAADRRTRKDAAMQEPGAGAEE